MFVKERFALDSVTIEDLYSRPNNFGYNGFGEFIFRLAYSRKTPTGQEDWADVVKRVTEGTFSIRKDHYLKNHIHWDESFWQHYARQFAISLFLMQWLPPGRGLWAMGSDHVYNHGSMALNNCAIISISDEIGKDIHWMMDSLMCGVGVGFLPVRSDDLVVYSPMGHFEYVVPDTREGWCEATKILINSYLKPYMNAVKLDYSLVRPAGLPIKGFGGISSGPGPLVYYHEQIRKFFSMYGKNGYDSVMLKADLANACGCCVVSGNVRRSAQLLLGPYDDVIDLKDYEKNPHRVGHGWMSNNSVALVEDSDFERLGEIADRVVKNGEPGFVNFRNVRKGRVGRNDGLRTDLAIAQNPCAEISLENRELCCLSSTCPTRCSTVEVWLKSCEFAALYASTVSLLPTHRLETNEVINRNRRIGVGIIDVVGWEKEIGTTRLIRNLRAGYDRVRATNKWANGEAGVPEAIRVTSIQPGGTTPKIAGLRSGWQWPTFGLTLRRVRVAQNSPLFAILHDAGVPHEPDTYSALTEVFEFPIDQGSNGAIQPATEISIWRQAMMLVLLQREWADNAVSNTLYFKPKWELALDIPLEDVQDGRGYLESKGLSWEKFLESQEYEDERKRIILTNNPWRLKVYYFNRNHEEDDVEAVLAAIAPLTKSVSLLPHSPKGVYVQTPEEGLTREEYDNRLAAIKPINWSGHYGTDGQDEKYCSGASCETRQ